MQNQIISAWKELAKNKKITARNTLTYILLRADGPTEALYHIRRAFSPIKNQNKLLNGRKPYDCLWTASNHDMEYCLYPRLNNGHFLKESVKKRIQEFGVEPSDEMVEEFVSKATEIMGKLK